MYSTEEGIGCIVFSPLAQGLLTNKYLDGLPADSRAAKAHGFLRPDDITPEKLDQVRRSMESPNNAAKPWRRLALAWVLRHAGVTSALIGASRVRQIEDGVAALQAATFQPEELRAIETILAA